MHFKLKKLLNNIQCKSYDKYYPDIIEDIRLQYKSLLLLASNSSKARECLDSEFYQFCTRENWFVIATIFLVFVDSHLQQQAKKFSTHMLKLDAPDWLKTLIKSYDLKCKLEE